MAIESWFIHGMVIVKFAMLVITTAYHPWSATSALFFVLKFVAEGITWQGWDPGQPGQPCLGTISGDVGCPKKHVDAAGIQ